MTDSAPRAFAPVNPRAVVAAPDGSWIAVVDATGTTILDPVTAAVHKTFLDASADFDVAWAGNPSRLLLVGRVRGATLVQLLDVTAPTPRELGHVHFAEPLRVLATGALHALLVGERGARVAAATNDRLDVGEFPAKSVPTAAGAFGPHHAIVAVNGALEEWDLHARQSRRRFRLPRPAPVRMVGGSERVLWTVSDADPTRVEIFPLVQRGQPKVHELPEPIAAISGHPRVELLVWIGAASGQARLLDLDGKGRGRELGEPGQKACALVGGSQISAVLAAPDAFLAIEVLDTRGLEPRRTSGIVSVLDPTAPADADALADTPEVLPTWPAIGELDPLATADAPAVTPPVRDDDALAAAAARTARAAATSARVDRAAAIAAGQVDRAVSAADRIAAIGATLGSGTPASAHDLAQRLAASAGVSAVADEARRGPPPPSTVRQTPPSSPRSISRAWRETLVDWTRTALTSAPPPAPMNSPIDPLVARLGLPAALAPGIALLYGAHLLGHDGIAAADLARALKGWDEALGNGVLAASGVAQWRRSRVRLAPVIRDALDDRPARSGTIVGTPGTESSLITPCAVRIGSGRAADAAPVLVERAGGAYFVPSDGADRADVLLEARARGAIALVPADAPADAGTARVIGPDADAGNLAVFDAT